MNPEAAIPILAVLGVIGGLALIDWRKKRRAPKKVVITSPKLGMLNLQGFRAEPLVAEDKTAIQSFFSAVEESTHTTPHCDVLFLYCDFDDEGCIGGNQQALLDIIDASGAKIVVIASESSGFIIGSKGTPSEYLHANLAVTLERNDDAFARFYQRLFSVMAKGVTMPVALRELTLQTPSFVHEGGPSGFFVQRAGAVTFK